MRIEGFLKSAVGRFVRERRGNFGILAAVLIPVILTAVAVSLDISKLLSDKGRLSAAMDAASLATASALTNGDITMAQAQEFAVRIAAGQMAAVLSDAQIKELKTSIVATVTSQGSGSKKDYTVKVTGRFTSQLMAFSAFHADGGRTVAGSSTSTSQAQTATAISLYLVVDQSGSMAWPTDTEDTTQPYGCYQYPEKKWDQRVFSYPCYISKIASLKTAAAGLFDQMDAIESADPGNMLVRTGVNSFNDAVQKGSPLAWGTKDARKYISNLPVKPTGGTDMTDALANSNNSLKSTEEAKAQAGKGNTTFKRFIVLMTDGENTGYSSQWNPSLDAETLRTCNDARSSGVEIFTVAYMAPPNGETLLKNCANNLSNYYKASDVKTLNKAFSDIGGKVANQTTRMTN
ncbi:MAG TPA: TadE/TadG family type IV pilus assembly protein [Ensifer sp.]|nr:TadE/TadG family type IV pilus assembly protein [Ensifer sp.]